MRIALVVERFDPRRGGLEQWTAQFVTGLLCRGHEVHVVARQFGAEIRQLPLVAHQLAGVRSRLGFAAAAEACLRQLAVDVIHDTGCGWYCDLFQPHGGSREAALEQNLQLTPPWWRAVRRRVDPWLPRYREFRRLGERQYAGDGRTFLAISRMVADDFHRYHGVPAGQIQVVYNGVDTERFTPDNRDEYRALFRRRLGLDEQTVLLLIVAHNFRLKGVPQLLHAVARLKKCGLPVHLAVVGGKRLGRYLQMAQRVGVSSRVTFAGSCNDPRPFYAAADVYVQPTYYDPCSLVALEALASGLPVITTRMNGVSELIRPGYEGFLIDDPGDVDTLVRRLEQLLSGELRRQMGGRARQLALAHPFSRNVDEILAVYQQMAGTRRRAA